MTLGERVKKARKALDLTQREFGARIAIKQNSVAQIEMGRNTSEQTIAAICKTFNVNETWLRTGVGEMFVPTSSNTLDVLTKEYALSHDARVLVEEFVNLKPEMQQVFIDFAQKAAEGFRSAPAGKDIRVPPAPDTSGQEQTEVDVAAELAELKRQNQELTARIAAMEEEERDEQLKADFGAAFSALQSGLAGGSEQRKK